MNLVFDIGANVGQTIEFFLSHAKKIVAFEPNPGLYNELRYKFDRKNVVLDQRGISNSVGNKVFNISNLHTLSTFSSDWIKNSRFSDTFDWDLELEVETTTLNNVLDEYGIPDYIKIDIEGHEFDVLTSFDRLLETTIIAFEWVEEENEKLIKIIEHLYNLGYKKFHLAFDDKILMDEQISWKRYDDIELIPELKPMRKEKWGMAYVKM